MKVKEQSYNGKFSGYLVNGEKFFPKENCEQVNQWIAEGNTPEPEFTELEIQTNLLNQQIQEAKNYLNSTDYYMTVDKYASLTVDKQLELTTERAEARVLINTLEAELILLQGANNGYNN